jgi:hypothetical protein
MTTHATMRIMKELREFQEHPDNNLYVRTPYSLQLAPQPSTLSNRPYRFVALLIPRTTGSLLRDERDAVQCFAYWPGGHAV